MSLRSGDSSSAIYAFIDAVSISHAVSDELNEAWVAAFGRAPNPSDACDRAIKALEELLIPLVIPGVAKPNLGGVAGELASACINGL